MRVDIIERISTFTPLGLRFWDPEYAHPVGDGMTATARPWGQPDASPLDAVRSQTGTLAFHGLPGLRDVENDGPDAITASPPTKRFLIEVRDEKRRYAPAAFGVDLPLPYRGVFLGPAAPSSPPPSPPPPPGFLLLTGPDRQRPPALAAVRGELVYAATGRPAAWALVQITDPDGGLWSGIADGDGRFSVILPWPVLEEVVPTSPPLPAAGSLSGRQWPLTVTVHATPAGLPSLTRSGVPDYAAVLAQAAIPVWPDPPGSPAIAPVPSLAATLVYGETLVVRTSGRSFLLVGAAPSSP